MKKRVCDSASDLRTPLAYVVKHAQTIESPPLASGTSGTSASGLWHLWHLGLWHLGLWHLWPLAPLASGTSGTSIEPPYLYRTQKAHVSCVWMKFG